MNSEANVALLKRVYTSIKYHLEVLDLLISKISDLESQKRINELKSNYLRIQEECEGIFAKYDVTPEYESELKKVLARTNLEANKIDAEVLGPLLIEASKRDINELRQKLDLVDDKDESILNFANTIFSYDEAYMAGLANYYPGRVSGA